MSMATPGPTPTTASSSSPTKQPHLIGHPNDRLLIEIMLNRVIVHAKHLAG
jgi:hypothetical protein